jgi:hypothetical protein
LARLLQELGSQTQNCAKFMPGECVEFRNIFVCMLLSDTHRMIKPMISFQAINIDTKCKHLSNFPTVTLWALWKNFFWSISMYICYWSNCLSCGHLYNGWFQSISMLITDVTFCWWMLHMGWLFWNSGMGIIDSPL